MVRTDTSSSSNELTLIDLGESHVEAAMALSREAHWNQTSADWLMMMQAGDAFGFQAPTGQIVASAIALPFGPEFGWISMVLVSSDWRRKGLATQLLDVCIKRLEQSGRTPMLDATPDGEHVYRPLGFVPHFNLSRWQHEAVETIDLQTAGNFVTTPPDPERIFEIDAKNFGGSRPEILQHQMLHGAEFSSITPSGDGYLLGRDGRLATQIGPIIATETSSALSMLDAALSKIKGPVFIDAVNHQVALTERLERHGFTRQRGFTRMAKGIEQPFGDPENLFAIAGPELG